VVAVCFVGFLIAIIVFAIVLLHPGRIACSKASRNLRVFQVS
jgi:hypothetical protein